jgi:hypothetical protein
MDSAVMVQAGDAAGAAETRECPGVSRAKVVQGDGGEILASDVVAPPPNQFCGALTGPERAGKRPSTCVVQYKTDRSGNVQTVWADKWCAPHAQPSPTAVQGVVCARTQCSVALQTLPVLVQFWDAD